uniref:Uncharacterized protein n=1 Tax=Salix viminalis TaxID=40686 RepID=A0A6N2L8C4_SALVM
MKNPSILVALTTYDGNFELRLMKEHGVKEPRIRMLVMESNTIDLEKETTDAVKLKSMEVLQEIQLAVRSIPYESGNADDLWCLLDIIRLVFGFY